MGQVIQWGIIGCGDVTEHKSGPAFNKVPDSTLVAVMRRDAAKAKDYAERHSVPKYYSDAQQLINDPDINAVYIATPPGSHEQYALEAMAAGKPVYVEKPMALNFAAAQKIKKFSEDNKIRLVVAHSRQTQPFFRAIKDIADNKVIGNITSVQLTFNRVALTAEELSQPQKAWRVDPALSGGGLSHDMAPHQLGLMLYFFGDVQQASGHSANTNSLYKADDRVEGNIVFKNGVRFHGSWDFNSSDEKDECIISGSEGSIRFPVFGKHEWTLHKNGMDTIKTFEIPDHVQQPMIQQTVQYFLGRAANPCPPEEGCEVMRLMEIFTKENTV